MRSLHAIRNRVRHIWRRVITFVYYRRVFGSLGERSTVYPFLLLHNPHRMFLGSRVLIRPGARFEVVLHGQAWEPTLRIGDNVNIEQNAHIICHDRVTIEDNVSITGSVAIVDVTHPHSAAFMGNKIGEAIDSERSEVLIGAGSFIGFGATILPGARIGRNCMVGAGSVVAGTIPDNSVAAGVPAKVLRVLNEPAPGLQETIGNG